jgi:hypothetical protein
MTLDSVGGDTVPMGGGFSVGAPSRSVRIEKMTRELSNLASAEIPRSERESNKASQQQWWRIDGNHGPVHDTAMTLDRESPIVGVFDEEPVLKLRGLLSTQVQVGSHLSRDGQHHASTDAVLQWDSTCKGASVGVSTNEGSAPHDQASHEILTDLRLRNSASSSGKSPAMERDADWGNHALGAASPVIRGPFGDETELGGAKPRATFDACEPAEFLRDSTRITCGSFRFCGQWENADRFAERGDVSVTGAVATDSFIAGQIPVDCTKTVSCSTIDANRFFRLSDVLTDASTGAAVSVVGTSYEQTIAQSDFTVGQRSEFSALRMNFWLATDFGTEVSQAQLANIGIERNSTLSGRSVCQSDHALTPGCETVRWFVGSLLLIDLLLMDQGSECINASSVVRAVSEVDAGCVISDQSESPILCGAWVPRNSAQKPVDIHRVILEVTESDSQLCASRVIIASLNSRSLKGTFGYATCVSAAVHEPRCWTRVSEFRYVVDAVTESVSGQVGCFVAFAAGSAAGSAVECLSDEITYDVFDWAATKLVSVDWVDQAISLTNSQRGFGIDRIARRPDYSGLVPSGSGLLWDGAVRPSDFVRYDRIQKALLPVQVALTDDLNFVTCDQADVDGLAERARTGPTGLSGLENFRSVRTPCAVTRNDGSVSIASDMHTVASLDNRFLRSWSLAQTFTHHFEHSEQSVEEALGTVVSLEVGIRVDVGIHESGVPASCMWHSTGELDLLLEHELNVNLSEPEMVMRPVESPASMQAATSFFFRHRARSKWISEQVSNVVLQKGDGFANQHFISCQHAAAGNVMARGSNTESQSDAHFVDALAKCDGTSQFESLVVSQTDVIAIGGTPACALSHVPQYLNRAAWCRDGTPSLFAASSQIHVAEDFFPPLASFELPRLVMPQTSTVPLCIQLVGTMAMGVLTQRGSFPELIDDGTANDSGVSLGIEGIQPANWHDNSFFPTAAVRCPTSSLITRLRAVESLRTFSNPLRNYLRANWSLVEVIGGDQIHSMGKPEGGNRFLVMTDKRSVSHLQDSCGVELVSELVVQPEPASGVTAAVSDSKSLLPGERLMCQSFSRVRSSAHGMIHVASAASPGHNLDSPVAAIRDQAYSCSLGIASSVLGSTVSVPNSGSVNVGMGIVWKPQHSNTLVEPIVVRFNLDRPINTVAGERLALPASPVLVQCSDGPMSVNFSTPIDAPDAVERNQGSAFLTSTASLHQSIRLGETCRAETCTHSFADRAA